MVNKSKSSHDSNDVRGRVNKVTNDNLSVAFHPTACDCAWKLKQFSDRLDQGVDELLPSDSFDIQFIQVLPVYAQEF